MNWKTLIYLLKTDYTNAKGRFNHKKCLPDQLVQAIRKHTDFLSYDALLIVRVSYILNNYTTQLTCKKCNKLLELSKSIDKASMYCSAKCSHSSDDAKNRRTATNLLRYGVSNPFESKAIKDKIKETLIERYGVDNPAKAQEVKDKISNIATSNASQRMIKTRQTVQQKYNVNSISQMQSVKDLKQKTAQLKWGVNHYFQTDEFKQKTSQLFEDKYGVSNSSKAQEVKDKIKKTKHERYESPNYNNRQQAMDTMIAEYGNHVARIHWPSSTAGIMSDKDLLECFIKDKTICCAAAELEVAPTTLRNKIYEYQLFDYTKRKNQYEQVIEDLLTDYNVQFTKNNRSILQGKEIDFMLPEYNIGIECNGMFWHSELMGKDKWYHFNKTNDARIKNIRLIHFWDYQFDNNTSLVRSVLKHTLGFSDTRIMARKTKIQEITSCEYRNFLNNNHLQGAMNSSVKYGLTYNNVLVAVMGFGKSRFAKGEFELHRFAVKQNYAIAGGASKMFSHFLQSNLDISTIISYASKDNSVGNLYTQLKFKKIAETPPNYFYFKNRKIYNRIAFQKHKLKSVLENFDPNKTEWENLKENGYNRFWDTGNIKYEYQR
jgi:hypothetical protein